VAALPERQRAVLVLRFYEDGDQAMTHDVEERLAVALRTRAEAPVDADALLAGALVAGRARARRHRLVTAGSAGVAG
jgi:hypothetical protein